MDRAAVDRPRRTKAEDRNGPRVRRRGKRELKFKYKRPARPLPPLPAPLPHTQIHICRVCRDASLLITLAWFMDHICVVPRMSTQHLAHVQSIHSRVTARALPRTSSINTHHKNCLRKVKLFLSYKQSVHSEQFFLPLKQKMWLLFVLLVLLRVFLFLFSGNFSPTPFFTFTSESKLLY